MRALIQRVTEASVTIRETTTGRIGPGMLILLGIEESDTAADVEWLVKKILALRIFNDREDVMNLSVKEVQGEILLVSQFTLHASTRKGNRPSFIRAARPEKALPLYQEFISLLEKELSKSIQTGEFGAMMKVSLVNDGPVTIMIDSKSKE